MSAPKQQRAFPVVGNGRFLDPNYARVVRVLDDGDLQAELDAGRGDAAYRDAVRAEQKRREEDQ